MRWYKVSARTVGFGLGGWFAGSLLLILGAHFLPWWPLSVAGFMCLALLPGFAVLRLLKITLHSITGYLLFSFALSLLVIMASGLLTNQLLFALGVAHPLSFWGAFGGWSVCTAALIAASVLVNRTPFALQIQRKKSTSWPGRLLLGLSLILPVCATFGAWRLNNGSDGLVAFITVCLAALLIVGTFIFRKRVSNGLIMWIIFILSASVLFMTSMRGWDIVGHDLQREFRVFTLTNLGGHWDMNLDRDPYNACLSITILPHILATLLGISGVVVFKVLLQLGFAACVVVVYMMLRRYVSTLGAFSGSLLFICYPTFINDAAMLTRQGIAYLFFALAILLLSHKVQRRRHKLLFLLCALGAIVSHYSTAYMFVALFAVAALCKVVFKLWARKRKAAKPERTILSPVYAALLFVMTFLWYSQITETSSGLMVTLQKSINNIPSLFSEEHKSTDVSSAILFSGGKSQVDLYQDFLTASATHIPETINERELEFLPSLTPDVMPITWLGERARDLGIDLSLPTTLRQQFAKILQLLAIAGVVYMLYRLVRGRPEPLSPDFVFLSIAGMAVLALMVVLPVLSVNYGVLRAFQQVLIFLLLPMVFLLAALARRLPGKLTVTIVTTGTISIFLLFTGAVAQTLGGSSPNLTMNNTGLYYGLYYSPASDQAAFEWLKQHATSDVRAANPNRALMHDPQYPFKSADILPTQTTPASYVYLDHAQTITRKFYVYYESSPLVMTFPLDYFDVAKNLLYTTLTTRIYR